MNIKPANWENWHWLLKYLPIVPVWVWLCYKGRSWWFFTTANPNLRFSGFIYQSKRESYQLLPPHSYPSSILIAARANFKLVLRQLAASGIRYPLIVKPNVGQMGLLFRVLPNEDALRRYHTQLPIDYLIQAYSPYPTEVSVYYYRYPGRAQGVITGFVMKQPLTVVGDGESSLKQLIRGNPKAALKQKEIFIRHQGKLNYIPAKGERYQLISTLNLSQGGELISMEAEKDADLLAVFDRFSHHTNFYFGRYDIRCSSVAELKRGENFHILEVNGCGAEPHHVYGNENTLRQAYQILTDHWCHLYAISEGLKTPETPPWKFWAGLRYTWKAYRHYRLLKRLEQNVD
jgi:hypothetical protein